MGKLFRTRDKLLLGLAILGDLYTWSVTTKSRTIRDLKRDPWSSRRSYPGSLRTAVSRMLKTGLIEKRVKGGEAVWELTGLGKNRLHRSFPLLKWQEKKWDGWWRIVIFDITAKRNWIRDKLRRKLLELGFGRWQESVYTSPHDVAEDMKEFLQSEHLEEQVSILETRELWPNNQEKIERMWKLNKLNKKYLTIVEKFQEGKKQKLRVDYLAAVGIDPFLPKQFLPQPWFGDEARRIISRLR